MNKNLIHDPRMKAARELIERSAYVMERERQGRPMSRRNARRYMGCYPEEVLPWIEALTAHISISREAGALVARLDA